jgi:hypothetical protein
MGEIADYAIDRALASEADHACFEAHHMILPRRAHITVATAPSAAQRIIREACVLESLNHPGIPRVFDCGVIADGLPWVARELVGGTRVAASLGPRDVAELLREVAGILAHAHGRGVIHGDVWLDAVVRVDGALRVLNWRHARTGNAADGAGDVYALGLAAYATLPADPPRRLGVLLAEMLAADPDARPTAETVAREAARILDDPADDDVEEVALLVDLSRDANGASGSWEIQG